MLTGFLRYINTCMTIDTLEQIATWLLGKQIPFTYSSTILVVENNQLIPAFKAIKHNVTGEMILTDGNYNPITKTALLDIIETF